MRTPTDNPTDDLGGLGAPVRPPAAAPAAPATAPHFELGNWGATLPDGLAEKPAPAPESTLSPAELQGIADAESLGDWLGW
ncbi:MAG: hypothetical protein EOP35_01720 [Rubrivivax sp.]|nr:MAG: hypothetical protein EOP35_01720 [Rubrivivax sp.]